MSNKANTVTDVVCEKRMEAIETAALHMRYVQECSTSKCNSRLQFTCRGDERKSRRLRIIGFEDLTVQDLLSLELRNINSPDSGLSIASGLESLKIFNGDMLVINSYLSKLELFVSE